jgi:hypothetical protein
MKGRYNGCTMNVYSAIPGSRRLASIPKLSSKARQRLKWFDYYNWLSQLVVVFRKMHDTMELWKMYTGQDNMFGCGADLWRLRIGAPLPLQAAYPSWGKRLWGLPSTFIVQDYGGQTPPNIFAGSIERRIDALEQAMSTVKQELIALGQRMTTLEQRISDGIKSK